MKLKFKTTLWGFLVVSLTTATLLSCTSITQPSPDQRPIKPREASVDLSERMPQRRISLKIFLDLPARQALLNERWARPPLHQLPSWLTQLEGRGKLSELLGKSFSKTSSLYAHSETLSIIESLLVSNFSPLGIRLDVTEIISWESSNNGVALSLDQLGQQLRDHEKYRENPSDSSSLFVGITSTPAPSFAQLSDMMWARPNIPIIITRRPIEYYGQADQATGRATARLIIRGIAESLGFAPVCDGGWGGVSRDRLMGLLSSPALSPQQIVNNNLPRASVRDPYLGGAQPNAAGPSSSSSLEVLWRFDSLGWSDLSKRLAESYIAEPTLQQRVSLTHLSCRRFRTLQERCPRDDSMLKRSAASLCMSKREPLMEIYREGLLNGEMWLKYQTTALGFEALKNGHIQLAYDRCRSVAKHYPSLLASKCAGFAADRLGMFDEAILYLRAYISSHPDDIGSISRLAKVLGLRGRDREAIALLRRLSKRAPTLLGDEYSRILFNLGVAEAKLGYREAALLVWRKIPVDDEMYQDARQLIEAFTDGSLDFP